MSLQRCLDVANGVRGSKGTISMNIEDVEDLKEVTTVRKFKQLEPVSSRRYEVPAELLCQAVDSVRADTVEEIETESGKE